MSILDLATMLTLQHTITGGTFTGAEIGRASATLGLGTSQLVVKSRFLGAAGNSTKIEIRSPSSACPLGIECYENQVVITPAHDGSAITSTAAQVAALINATVHNRLSVYAYAPNGSGVGLIAPVAATALTGGADPSTGPTRRCTSNTAGGLFYFDQTQPVEVLSIEGYLAASVAYTVKLVKYDACYDVGGEDVTIMSTTGQNIFQTFTNLIIPAGRALKVAAPTTGFVRAVVRAMHRRF